MTDAIKEPLAKARSLAPAERASLVGELLATLDAPDAGIEAAWRDEVERRIDVAEREPSAAIPWVEARSRLGL